MTDVELKILKAVDYFEQGWSLNVAMSKAGFSGNWSQTSVANNITVIDLRRLQLIRIHERRKLKASGVYID